MFFLKIIYKGVGYFGGLEDEIWSRRDGHSTSWGHPGHGDAGNDACCMMMMMMMMMTMMNLMNGGWDTGHGDAVDDNDGDDD